MLFSTNMMCNAFCNMNSKTDTLDNKPLTTGQKVAASIFLSVALVVFMLELLVLVYAIQIAVSTTNHGKERTLHILFAVFATGPYVLLQLFFGNSNVKSYLAGSTKMSMCGL